MKVHIFIIISDKPSSVSNPRKAEGLQRDVTRPGISSENSVQSLQKVVAKISIYFKETHYYLMKNTIKHLI